MTDIFAPPRALSPSTAAALSSPAAAEKTAVHAPSGLSSESSIGSSPAPLLDTVTNLFEQRESLTKATAAIQFPAIEEISSFNSAEAEALVGTTAASTGARPSSIRALLKEIAALGRMFNAFSTSYRELYIHSLTRYAEFANNQVAGMNAMALATLLSSVAGGAAGMAAPLAPGLIPAGGLPNMSFITAEFVQTVLKHTGDILPRMGDGIKTVLQGPVVQAESQRAMVNQTEIPIQQQMMDHCTAILREARQTTAAIMQAKAGQDR